LPEKKEDKIPPYYEVYRLARQQEEKGYSVIHLEYGDPDIPTDPRIIDEMSLKALEGYTHYSNPLGLDELREKIAENMSLRLRTDISRDNVIVTIGSKSAIYISLRAFYQPRKSVLLISPIWGLYHTLLKEMGIDYVNYKTRMEDGWSPTDDLFDIRRSVGIIMVNNPNNPTSKVWDNKSIKTIIDFARENNAVIISDEVYHDFSRKKFYSMLSYDYDKVICLYSFSKSYSMTGFRLGYIISPNNELLSKFAKLQQLYFTNVPVFIQYAGLKALEMPWIAVENIRILWRNTDFMSRGLKKMGMSFLRPEGAFYIFMKIPEKYNNSYRFCYDLLVKENLCFAPGEGFGGYDNFVRVSASLNIEKLRLALKRLERFLGDS
jgi:aspartate aminotransferase